LEGNDNLTLIPSPLQEREVWVARIYL
jgi:hypothetical protein